MAADRDPTALLPLTPAMFHVLVALADEPRHGYAIIKDVSARTAGKVELGTGTLYGIVKRLLAEGLAVARLGLLDQHRRPRPARRAGGPLHHHRNHVMSTPSSGTGFDPVLDLRSLAGWGPDRSPRHVTWRSPRRRGPTPPPA